MVRKSHIPLYRVRLKIAAVLNILEMMGVAASVTDLKLLEKGKPSRHAPFRTLLFALTVRCAGLLESAAFYSPAIKRNSSLGEAELSELEDTVSAKRKEIADAQRLLEKGMLAPALSRLAKSKLGLAELAEKLDAKIESRIK